MSRSVSVVVCAYTERRWAELSAAVRAAQTQTAAARLAPSGVGSGQRHPDEAPDVVLVIDHADALLERATAELSTPGTVIVANRHERGLSGARNTALEHTTAEIVAFLDDDAVPREGWLRRMVEHYADPRVHAVGGKAVPVFPAGGRPTSLPSATADGPGELDWVVGCTYAGQPTTPTPVRNLMGCNMSFRRDVFDEVGTFGTGLGRIGTTPLGCEETELCIRLTRHRPEAVILFDPAIVVDHHVTADRVRWRYLWSRCRAEGISKAFVARLSSHDAALATERRYVTTVLPRGVLRELASLPRRGRRSVGGVVAIVGGVAVTAFGYLTARRRGG